MYFSLNKCETVGTCGIRYRRLVGDVTRPFSLHPLPMHPAVKGFRFNRGYRFYQFTALPFSIATVFLEFTMVAKEVKLMALTEGISVHQFIDGWIMRTNSKQQCQENTHWLVYLVGCLGWITNF